MGYVLSESLSFSFVFYSQHEEKKIGSREWSGMEEVVGREGCFVG